MVTLWKLIWIKDDGGEFAERFVISDNGKRLAGLTRHEEDKLNRDAFHNKAHFAGAIFQGNIKRMDALRTSTHSHGNSSKESISDMQKLYKNGKEVVAFENDDCEMLNYEQASKWARTAPDFIDYFPDENPTDLDAISWYFPESWMFTQDELDEREQKGDEGIDWAWEWELNHRVDEMRGK